MPLCEPFKLAVTSPCRRRVEELLQSASGSRGLSEDDLLIPVFWRKDWNVHIVVSMLLFALPPKPALASCLRN